jgi:hypothetical protein
MTSHTTMTMPHSRRRKPATEVVDDLTKPQPQIADRPVHWTHIVVSRGKFARAISTKGRNVRLEIWLCGWRIAIYDEFGEQPHPLAASDELRNGISTNET